MFSKLYSAAIFGVEAFMVEIEVDIHSGLPSFNIVGLPDTAVQESRERVRAAIKNSEFKFPMQRITVNLAPADIKKEGPIFDLSIALAILVASKQVKPDLLNEYLIMGELSLDGSIKPVNGMLPIALMAKNISKKKLLVPEANAKEAGIVKELKVFPVNSLYEVIEFLDKKISIEPVSVDLGEIFKLSKNNQIDFCPPKPGLTVINNNMSILLIKYPITLRVVAGFRAIPDFTPASLMVWISLSRCLEVS
ncbi:unnamed protein product [marine sediment metagenome]|uniref:Magnesium chelatase ChlI-like catalytic domain-containing protein n=1 Tax=marine sediment metagenome TaxID=412755 RepID=X1T1K1_9ZZZZ